MSQQEAVRIGASPAPHATPASRLRHRCDHIVDVLTLSPATVKIRVDPSTSWPGIRDRTERVVVICRGDLLGHGEPAP
jgi:hypothetical protein